MRHVLDGRGSHSFQDLKDIGAELANVRTLTFAFGLIPVLNNIVSPMAMQTQDISDLPWARWRAFESCVKDMRAVRENLADLRKHLRLLVLIAPYLSDDGKALRCWWMGYCFSVSCRRLHAGGSHLAAFAYGVLWTGSFQGCDLLIAPTLAVSAGSEFAHPACLCGTTPQLIPGSDRRVRGGGDIEDPSEWRLGAHQFHRRAKRTVGIPWWVSRTLHSRKYWSESFACQDPYTELPRFQIFPRQGRGICRKECKASVVVRETLFLLDKGLEDLQCLWHDFANNVEEYCLGDRGVSRSMQHIWRNMAVAWWLPDIVAQPQPDSTHQRALLNLYSAMKSELQLQPWPGDEYASAPSVKKWPNREGIQHFYKIWWAKVHEAAKQEYRAAWFPVTHYIVVSPRQLLPIAMLCKAKLAAGSAAEAKASRMILERLSAFCAAPFRLQASEVVGGCLSTI